MIFDVMPQRFLGCWVIILEDDFMDLLDAMSFQSSLLYSLLNLQMKTEQLFQLIFLIAYGRQLELGVWCYFWNVCCI